jgi:DNA helicase-2/ATP-dependent DNA helicase PcrA
MSLLEGLNSQQRQAVTAPEGPVLVLAGPGSGKTRVLTHRLAYQILERQVVPSKMMAVTFTNKAAREMSGRVQNLLQTHSPSQERSTHGLSLGTFHAWAARMLRLESDQLPVDRNYVIFDEADQRVLISQVIKELNLDPKQYSPARIHGFISQAKNELIEAEDFPADSYLTEIVRRAYPRYQQLLLQNNALDFDDLLFWPVRLLREMEVLRRKYRSLFKHILVDEFQDTNSAQYYLLKLLGGEDSDLFVVGDPDQSIYRWRGADYRNVHRFQEDYPLAKTYLLEQNYRSTQNILDAAMGVIDRQPGRTKKNLVTDQGPGESVVLHEAYDEAEEAQYVVDSIATLTALEDIHPGDVAVMYRTNAQSRALEEAFFRVGLPYRLVGAQRFYGRREIKDLIAYLRITHNPSDQVSLLRILNTPPRGIGSKTVEALLALANRLEISPAKVLLDLATSAESTHAASLSPRASARLTQFGEMLARWTARKEQVPLGSLIDQILEDSGYTRHLEDGTEEGTERVQNIMELRNVAEDFADVGLAAFLEQVALISDQDTLTESIRAPTLLTLHAAKGLEFPIVFLIGLDEGVLPHQRSLDEPEALAEERRLFYVGLTRAMDRVFIVRAFRRRQFGVSHLSDPSRFLEDLPIEVVEGDLSSVSLNAQASYARQTRWDSKPVAELAQQYKVGMRVQHPKFGEGIVMESRLEYDDEEVTVAFADTGIKRLAASIANLQILEG